MRLIKLKPVHPLTPAMVKKGYKSLEKQIEEDKNLFYFTIRTRNDNHLVGKAILEWIDWSNGNGYLRLGIGSIMDRGRGFGKQALGLLLCFAFTGLNLFRVTIVLPEYCQTAVPLFRKFGFIEESAVVKPSCAMTAPGTCWFLACCVRNGKNRTATVSQPSPVPQAQMVASKQMAKGK